MQKLMASICCSLLKLQIQRCLLTTRCALQSFVLPGVSHSVAGWSCAGLSLRLALNIEEWLQFIPAYVSTWDRHVLKPWPSFVIEENLLLCNTSLKLEIFGIPSSWFNTMSTEKAIRNAECISSVEPKILSSVNTPPATEQAAWLSDHRLQNSEQQIALRWSVRMDNISNWMKQFDTEKLN